MSVTDQQIKYIITRYPAASDDNTEFCLRFWETACEQRKIEFPEELKAIIRLYKPEAITRKRRELIEPTAGQREEEYQMHKKYS